MTDTTTPPEKIWVERHSNHKLAELAVRPAEEVIDTAFVAYVRKDLTGWRGMDSAPRDGTMFQVWCRPDGGANTAERSWEPWAKFGKDGQFLIWGRVDYDIEDWDCFDVSLAAAWMPLPTPPEARP